MYNTAVGSILEKTPFRDALVVMLLFAAVFIIYSRTFSFGLVWDTQIFIQESYLLRQDRPLEEAFTQGYIYGQLGMNDQSFYYRPLVNASFMIEKELWGLKGSSLRKVNLVIFLTSLFLLFLFFKKQRQGGWFAPAALALICFSPLNAENVVWVVGRGDLLMCLFLSAALLLLHMGVERNRAFYFWGAALCYTLGLFSKETAIFFLPLFLIYEWQARKRINTAFHLSNILMTVLFFIIKNGLLGIGTVQVILTTAVWEYLRPGLAAIGYYTRLLLLPVGFDNFNFVPNVTTTANILLGVAALLGLLGLLFYHHKNKRGVFPVYLFIFTLAPYILLCFTTMGPFRISSRYMMVPFWAVTWILLRLVGRLRLPLRFVIVGILLLLYIPTLIVGLDRYRNNRAFWEDALRSHPNNSFVLSKMAEVADREGDDFSARVHLAHALNQPMSRPTAATLAGLFAKLAFQRADYQKARAWLDRISFTLSPYRRFHIDRLRARIALSEGRPAVAEDLLLKTIAVYPRRLEGYLELRRLYAGYGYWDKLAEFGATITRALPAENGPDAVPTREWFSGLSDGERIRFYMSHRNYGEAISLLERVADPAFETRLTMAELWYRKGESATGRGLVDQLVESGPNDADLLNRVVFFYLEKMKRVVEASQFAERSLEIKKDQPKMRGLLRTLDSLQSRFHPLDR